MTKRFIRQFIAVLTLMFPSMLNLEKINKTSHLMYTSLFEKMPKDETQQMSSFWN